jgi:S-adenosylmethionine-diacylglycerol 3-amino-3-carboxypropyl transferase
VEVDVESTTVPEQLASEVAQAADFSIVRYSQSWEDPLCLQRALTIDDDSNILSIAAAGDNSFALLAMGAGRVVSVDMNPTQCALVELKRAAILRLEHAELVRFLGAAECSGPERLALYRRVRSDIPPEYRAYWDEQSDAIARGVIHIGKLENMFRIFRSRILPLLHSKRTLLDGFEQRDYAGRDEFWNTRFNNRRFRLAIRLFFSGPVIARTGRDKAFFEHVEMGVSKYYSSRTRHSMVELDPVTNPFLQYILLGRYLDLETGHPYLAPQNHAILRQRMDRLEVRCAELESFLYSCEPDSFTGFNLSDIFEWMSDDLYAAMLRAIVRVAAPGARLAYWNNLVERKRPESMAHVLQPHPDLAGEIHTADRAFLYRDFQVEEVL